MKDSKSADERMRSRGVTFGNYLDVHNMEIIKENDNSGIAAFGNHEEDDVSTPSISQKYMR